MKALIAEDDLTSRTLLEAVLRKWGFTVVSAQNGREAWEALQAEDAPRLAIIDWMMPEMDGVELCRKLRQRDRALPVHVIFLTTRDRREDVIEGLRAGASDYVTKPFDREELHARVQVGRRVVELQSALARRVEELQDALNHVRTLQGILPICMHCHKIRTDQEGWERLEKYIETHSDAQFSHSLCPECFHKFYPEQAKENGEKTERDGEGENP